MGKLYKGEESGGRCLRRLSLVHKHPVGMSPVVVRNVLISDAVDQSCVDLLKTNNINVTCKYKLSKADLISEIAVSLYDVYKQLLTCYLSFELIYVLQMHLLQRCILTVLYVSFENINLLKNVGATRN